MNRLLSSKVLVLSVLALVMGESRGMQQAINVQQNQNEGKYCKDIVSLLRPDIQAEFKSWFAPTVRINSFEILELFETLGIKQGAEITDCSQKFAQFINDYWEEILAIKRAKVGNLI